MPMSFCVFIFFFFVIINLNYDRFDLLKYINIFKKLGDACITRVNA
jgi:hypothetical protein